MRKIIIALLFVFSGVLISNFHPAYGQEDPGKIIEQKRQELTEKERRLKSEEERIKNIEKEVDAKIQKLNQLLSQIENNLKKLAEVRSERIEHLVKTFEAMPPEESAVRLSAPGQVSRHSNSFQNEQQEGRTCYGFNGTQKGCRNYRSVFQD